MTMPWRSDWQFVPEPASEEMDWERVMSFVHEPALHQPGCEPEAKTPPPSGLFFEPYVGYVFPRRA